MIRDLGDSMRLEYATYDADNAPVAATVTLTVTDPAGSTTTPTVTSPSTGVYRASFTLSQAGTWLWKWAATGGVVDVEFGDVTVTSTPAEDLTWYTSKALVKDACGISQDDIERDPLIVAAIASASRGIDNKCGFPRRRFWRDTTAQPRVFLAAERGCYDGCSGEWVFEVDDLSSITNLVIATSIDGSTWTTVDAATIATIAAVGPDGDRNPLANEQAIVELRSYGVAWWAGGRLVRITERWGWPAKPAAVEQGALLQSSRLFARRNSPEGVTGNAEWGIQRVSRLDPDVRAMISPYILDGIA